MLSPANGRNKGAAGDVDVIVKKVQTNKVAAPKSRALHARDLCDYIAGPTAGDKDEKVEHRGAVNVLNLDHNAQVQEMADLAETAKRSPQPVQHWILSWRQGEQPTAAQADDAVRIFLGEMGLAEHQCIYALHRNTDNCHLHLAINRVHPESERVITVNGGFDIEVAHKAVARIERAQGWQRERGARYQVLEGGELQRAEKPPSVHREPTTPARDFENQTGNKSAQRTAIEEGAEVLRRARDWGQVHEHLAERGMRFEKKGSGAILWVGDVAVKASTAGRDCSMSALQKRLGEFVPATNAREMTPRSPEPIAPEAPGWTKYIAERQSHYTGKTQGREHLRMQQREEWEGMVARHRRERHDTLGGDWRGKGEALNALRSVLAAQQAQDKAAMRERQELERSALRERYPRWPGFEEWLGDRGNPELAQQWRFRDRTPASIVGDQADPARPRDIRAFVAEARGWEVLYRRANAPNSQPCFADRGREIRIHDLSRESVLAALQLSAQKWGTFQVWGSNNYKRQCTQLAAEHGFRIINPELQQAIATERQSRLARQHGGGPPCEPARPSLTPDPPRHAHPPSNTPRSPAPVRDVNEAYRRHFEDVRRAQHHRNIDISRLDGVVAVRLRATGHGRDDVERAIRSEAPKVRPNESRDWEAYAKRTAWHAFGVSGERDLHRLAPIREALLTLEGRLQSKELSLDFPRRRGPGLGR